MPELLETLWSKYQAVVITFLIGMLAAIIAEIRNHYIEKLMGYIFNRPNGAKKVRALLLQDIGEKYKKMNKSDTENGEKINKLVIEENILPDYKPVSGSEKDRLPINKSISGVLSREIWFEQFTKLCTENDERIILLMGQGGAGKSVTMWYILQRLISQRKACDYIPYYLDLKNDYEQGCILNDMCKYMGLEDKYKNWEYIKKKYFGCKKGRVLNILILADGYNEASEEIRNRFDDEIFEIYKNDILNIKVILSSRYIPLNMGEKYNVAKYGVYTPIELSEDNITKYLIGKGLKEDEFRQIKNILRLPILLTMYCKSMCIKIDKQTAITLKMKDNYKTASDIYWNYSRIHILSYLKTRPRNSNPVTLQNYYIILFHILPYIGYRMGEKISLKKSEMCIIIKEFCCDNLGCLFSRDYMNAHNSSIYTPKRWECPELKDENKIMNILCKDFALMNIDSKSQEQYTFSHHLYRDFYSALYSYNISMVMVYQNMYIDEKPILSNSVRVFYNQIMDLDNILSYTKNNEEKNGFSKACNIISDLFYYGDHPDIPKDSEKALKYAELSAKAGNAWGQWDTAYLCKTKAADEKDPVLRKEFFIKSYNYAKMSVEKGYYGGYNILAQFYINKWPPCQDMLEEETLDKAVDYLEKAEEKGYNFAFNNHGILIEKGRIKSESRESRINNAFKLFRKSAELGDTWAKSRVAFYIRHYWRYIDDYYDIDEQDAKDMAFKVCNEEYEKMKSTKDMMNSDNIHGYADILMNLGEYYLDSINEIIDEERRINKLNEALPIFKEAYFWWRRLRRDYTKAGMRVLYISYLLGQDISDIDREDLVHEMYLKYDGKIPESPENDIFKEAMYFDCYNKLKKEKMISETIN